MKVVPLTPTRPSTLPFLPSLQNQQVKLHKTTFPLRQSLLFPHHIGSFRPKTHQHNSQAETYRGGGPFPLFRLR